MAQQNSKRPCPHCGSDNDPDASYCGRCGYRYTRNGTDSTVDAFLGTTIPALYPALAAPRKRNIIRIGFFAALLVLLIGVLVLGINLGRGGTTNANAGGKTPVTRFQPTVGNTPGQPTTTPTAENASPTPAATTPTATVCSPTPCVLYQAGGSNGWSNWAFSTDWRQVANGIVISDGGGSPPSAVSPYTVPTGINFAVEAEMMTPDTTSQWWEYGIAACGATQGNQWTGYVGRIAKDYSPVVALLTRFSSGGGSDFGQHVFDPGTSWHTFRLEVRGNVVTFKVDGAPVVLATDQEFLPCGNQVGFYDGGGVQREVEVRSFKVFAI